MVHSTPLHVPPPDTLSTGLARRLGYGRQTNLSEDMSARVAAAVDRASAIAAPRAWFRSGAVIRARDNGIRCDGFTLHSRLWANLIQRAVGPKTVVLFAVTLGPDMDGGIRNAQSDSLADGYLLDAAGSELIEQCADSLAARLPTLLELQSLQQSHRFSPGYCDCPLDDQHLIADYLDFNRAGIRVVESGGMTPAKTLTGAIVFAERLQAKSPCASCNSGSCDHRRSE